jgi:hypothetical protein
MYLGYEVLGYDGDYYDSSFLDVAPFIYLYFLY